MLKFLLNLILASAIAALIVFAWNHSVASFFQVSKLSYTAAIGYTVLLLGLEAVFTFARKGRL